MFAYVSQKVLRAIPFEKIGAGMSASLKKIPRVGGLDNFSIPRVGSLNFFGNSGGGWYARNPTNILWGSQMSLNPYFSSPRGGPFICGGTSFFGGDLRGDQFFFH